MIQPPPPFHLRALKAADIPAVMTIERLSLPTPRKEAVYRHEITHNSLAHYQALTRLAPGQETLLGYAGYWKIADEIHISIIAVDPPWRRRGLGELLLLNTLFLALEENASLVTLEVRQSNQVAQKLYQKYHFAEVGLRRGYYHDTGEDAILMTVLIKGRPEYEIFLRQRKNFLFQQLAHNP